MKKNKEFDGNFIFERLFEFVKIFCKKIILEDFF